MPFRKPVRSSESLTVVGTWLETPHHLGRNIPSSGITNSESVPFLTTGNDLLSGESSETSHVNNQKSSSSQINTHLLSASNLQQDTSRHLSIQAPFQHPGVDTLLVEYYKLLEVSSSSNQAISKSNRYRPSIMTRLWNMLTTPLPSVFQFGRMLRWVKNVVRYTAPSSPGGIILVLLCWLLLLRAFYDNPLLFLTFMLFGIYYLVISDKKHRTILESKINPKTTLHSFEVKQQSMTNRVDVKEAFKNYHRRRLLVNKILKESDWPNHVPKPVNCEKEDIATVQRSIERLQIAVIGPEINKPTSVAPHSVSFESAMSSVQELCTLVGVDGMNSEDVDWSSLRAKVQELEDELGL